MGAPGGPEGPGAGEYVVQVITPMVQGHYCGSWTLEVDHPVQQHRETPGKTRSKNTFLLMYRWWKVDWFDTMS